MRVVDAAAKRCGEWSPLTPYIRTFTVRSLTSSHVDGLLRCRAPVEANASAYEQEEEDAKRAGTIFEHVRPPCVF